MASFHLNMVRETDSLKYLFFLAYAGGSKEDMLHLHGSISQTVRKQ